MLRIAGPLAALVLFFAPEFAPAQTVPVPAEEVVTLQPGDVLKVEIWREEDLSGEFIVDEFGTVTLPLLGDRQVTGAAMRGVRENLIKDYRLQLRNPSISITPLRRINVLGEVNKPGVYEVDPTISLAAAVALAGGATPNGDLKKIRVVRGNEVIRERVGAESSLNTVDIRSGDEIFVDRRSWFERNTAFVVGTLLSATSIAVTIIAQLGR